MSRPPGSTAIDRHANSTSKRAATRPVGVLALDPEAVPLVYSEDDREAIAREVDLRSDPVITQQNWRDHRDLLKETELIFSGWKAPLFDKEFLDATPRLRAVFYAAGTVRYCMTEEFWKRGVTLCGAYAANAVPVAEYTVSTTILSLKKFWRCAELAKRGHGWGDHTRPLRGSYRAVVGLLSFGMIARKVAEMLIGHDMQVLVYCPYLTEAEAARSGVKKVGLDELFRLSDVVSVHTPALPETLHLVNGRLVSLMKPDATLINTARGMILDEASVIEVLRVRSDLTAILDVTDPEPPAASSPLLSLRNVIVTSHIAGSHGAECARLGHYMREELSRYLAGMPLRWRITHEMAQRMA